MNEQEAQQAIANARANAATTTEWLNKPGYSTLGEAVQDRAKLLEIVESQAQKSLGYETRRRKAARL